MYRHHCILDCMLFVSYALDRKSIDEDMTPMHTTMIGAWNGVEEVQQGFPSQQGGLRLIRFESPRWRPKAIQVRVQFEVQKQCPIKRTPGRIRSLFWMFYIWLEAEFHKASNGTGLMLKFVPSQRESAKQVDVQNLPGRCANTFWAGGPTRGPCGPRVLFTRVNSTGYCSAAPRGRQGLRPLFR
jgi:hypothetical protein